MATAPLEQAIQALRSGEREPARRMLLALSEAEPTRPEVWLWLAGATDDAEWKRTYLRRVLALNPSEQRAVAALQALGVARAVPTVASAVPASTPIVADATPAAPPNALAAPRFAATGVRARRPIPWTLLALLCAVAVLIPLTLWLI